MQSSWVVTVALLALAPGRSSVADGEKIKFTDCPPAVQRALKAEAKGARIESVTREKEEDEGAIYWTEVAIGGKKYEVGVLEDGTLSEMNLSIDAEAEVALDRSPAAVQATFQAEGFGVKVATFARDRRYSVTIFEITVDHRDRSYHLAIAEDGTLVEKVLVIDDEELELTACPATVQAALREHAKGGTVLDITRSTGIGKPTYEAEVQIKQKVYLVEVAEDGHLISKSLEAVEE